MKRAVLVGILVVVLLGVWIQPALGLWGDNYDEGFNGGSGWRGVAGSIYLYDWTLVQSPPASQPGRIVNSLYVHHVNYNPYDARWVSPYNFNDGYRDGTSHNYIHLEVGIDKGNVDLTNRYIFWQWNDTADGLDTIHQAHPYYYTGSGTAWVNGFKIGNVSMGSSGDEEWHINWNGATMTAPRVHLIVGRAMVSAERLWRTSYGGDGAQAHFKNLERKNSNAAWLTWRDANPIANGDGYASFTKHSDTDLSHSAN